MERRLFFMVILMYFIFVLAESHTIVNTALAQGGPRPDGRPPMNGRSQDVSKEIENMLSMEGENPTTSQNVQERYRRLTQVISIMLQSGKPVKNILPKDEGSRIDALIRDKNSEEAAKRVHDAILKLNTADTGKPEGVAAQGMSIVSSVPILQLNIHRLANKNSFDNILKLLNLVIDPVNRRLYFGGSKSTFIGVVDIDKDELIETFDIGVPAGFLIPDFANGAIYSMEIGSASRIYKIDIKQKKMEEVSSMPSYLSIPKKGESKKYKGLNYKETGYPFAAGYLQEENAAYGVIVITDSTGREVGRIKHGPDALYFGIDEKTGKLYTTNTGDGSISIFDLNNKNRKIKDIDIGTSIDGIELLPDASSLYIRNRLGGSTIFNYNLRNNSLSTIPNENAVGSKGIGMWPSGMVYDDGKLYILSHYAGRVDVIDVQTNTVVSRIPLNLSLKPRTDSISTITMDRRRKIIYVAFPELGEVAVADAKGLRYIKTIKIEGFDKSKSGPAQMTLSVDEELNKLFVYIPEGQMLYAYHGTEYSLAGKASVSAERVVGVNVSNYGKKVLYIGNKLLDPVTLEVKGNFSRGSRVIGFNNDKNMVYLSESRQTGSRKLIEKVYGFEDSVLKKEWTLSPILSIASSFAFDFGNNKFYVGYFESAIIEVFSLTTD